eukprot:m.30133 g.30133  ORF g.30133 m.30133 type:complete len:263 (+) comp5175_c0_seq1:159-947(+)
MARTKGQLTRSKKAVAGDSQESDDAGAAEAENDIQPVASSPLPASAPAAEDEEDDDEAVSTQQSKKATKRKATEQPAEKPAKKKGPTPEFMRDKTEALEELGFYHDINDIPLDEKILLHRYEGTEILYFDDIARFKVKELPKSREPEGAILYVVTARRLYGVYKDKPSTAYHMTYEKIYKRLKGEKTRNFFFSFDDAISKPVDDGQRDKGQKKNPSDEFLSSVLKDLDVIKRICDHSSHSSDSLVGSFVTELVDKIKDHMKE